MQSKASQSSARETLRKARAHAGHAGAPGGDVPSRERWPRVPGYDLVDVVGQGGMGVVYEGLQQGTGRRVAIKMLHTGAMGKRREALARRLEREVELVARLAHPGIVSLIGGGEAEDGPYLVMEFVDGVPLHE